MVTRTNHVIPGPNLQYITRGPRYLELLQHLPAIGVDHKKAFSSKSGALGTVPCGKSGPDYFITILKRLYESLI